MLARIFCMFALLAATLAPGHAGERDYFDAMFGTAPGLALSPQEPTDVPQPPTPTTHDPRFVRQVVPYDTYQAPGTIIVDTGAHHLFLVLEHGRALRYGIGVARAGFEWSGTHRISAKREWPGWTPPAAMRRRQPELPAFVPGGPDNPLGARALYIGDTLYRIHGTNQPHTIGGDVSSGCIRMTNADVIDLFGRVAQGAKVIVT